MRPNASPKRDANKSGLKILFTNAFIGNWTGSELYIRDVAVELIKRGHKPVVFSPRLGKLALDFRAKSIPVSDSLKAVGEAPDLIHGQHHLETMIALSHYPFTPAVFFCHGWLPWEEKIPIHPRILRYVTVSDALHDRLVDENNIPDEKITTIYNFVDLEKFRQRPPLPAFPKRALVFDNQASETNVLSTIREFCVQNGITLDIIGYEAGNLSMNPEQQLGKYDLIFARGRAALESIATGAAVICCGTEGLGGMVTTHNLDWMKRNNFGIRVLSRPVSTELLTAELQHYDAADAKNVSEVVRSTAGLSQAFEEIFSVYRCAVEGWAGSASPDPVEDGLAFSNYLKSLADDYYRISHENHLMLARAGQLQAELDDIHSRSFWKAYVRVARVSWLRQIYLWATAPFRRR